MQIAHHIPFSVSLYSSPRRQIGSEAQDAVAKRIAPPTDCGEPKL